jgi:hypothetical protein
MMHEHILKAVLSQGGSALGRFVRWWLLVVAELSTGFGVLLVLVDAHGRHVGAGDIAFGMLMGLFGVGPLVAVPAAVAVAVAFVAIKF